MDAIAKLGRSAARASGMIETGGLWPTAMGARVRLAEGKLTVTDGSVIETKEVVGGYAVFDLASKLEAMEWSTHFMELHRLYCRRRAATSVLPARRPTGLPSDAPDVAAPFLRRYLADTGGR